MVAGMLAAGQALADQVDTQKCKTSDRYHDSLGAFYACDNALKQKDLSKEDRAELLLGRGEAAYFAGRFDLSSADLDEALNLNPNLNEAYLRRAWTRLRANQYPNALQDLTTLLSIEPDNVDALFAIGFIYHGTPEWQSKTMPAYERVLKLNPNHFLTRLNLGGIHENYEHRPDLAVAEYDRILSASDEELRKVRMWREPNCRCYDFAGNVRIARAETNSHMKKYEKALADYDRLIADFPEVSDAYVGRGRTYGWMRKFDKTLADAARAIEVAPYLPAQRLLEIQALYQLKRHDEAVAKATAFLEKSNYDFARGEAFFWRASSHKALRHPEESLADFEQSFVLSPQWLGAVITQLRYSGYYAGNVTDSYSEKAKNGLQACILDPECAAR